MSFQVQQTPMVAVQNGYSNNKLLFNVFLVLVFTALVVYIFNTLMLAQTAGSFVDTRVDRMPRPQHNYILRSIDRAVWNPPWYNRRCPIGCEYTNRPNDRATNGWSCPNGPRCFDEWCCKYDRQCGNC